MYAQMIRRPLAILLLFGLAAFGWTRASAQPQLEGLEKLRSAFQRPDVQGMIRKLEMGEKQPSKEDQAPMDLLAKWLVYRFVSTPAATSKQIDDYHRTFEQHFNLIEQKEYSKKNREFVRQFGPILVKRYKVLFDQDFIEYRYPIVNAAPTLVQAARMRDVAFCDYLSELVTDHDAGKGNSGKNKHDVIKLYAVRAMRDYMPVEPREKDQELADLNVKRKARELRLVAALLSFIDKPAAKNLDEPEQNAIRFLRREALETLAKAEAPALVHSKGLVEAPIAPILLRALSPKGGLDPAPGLPERIEAAIGVCNLRCAKVPDYQPEVGVYLVGRTIVDYVTAFNKDLVDAGKGAVEPRPASLHWRSNAKRLETALAKLVENTKNTPAQAKAQQLQNQAGAAGMLKRLQDRNAQRVTPAELGILRNGVEKTRPASGQVFKGIKEYTIELDGE